MKWLKAQADNNSLELKYFPIIASYDWLYVGKIQVNALLLIRGQAEEVFERARLLHMVLETLVTEAEFQGFVKLYNDTGRYLIILGLRLVTWGIPDKIIYELGCRMRRGVHAAQADT